MNFIKKVFLLMMAALLPAWSEGSIGV